jgi:hypothetical protein
MAMKDDLYNEITSLKEKIKTIITLYEESKKINKQLTQEKQNLTKEVEEKNTELNDLKIKYETLKLAKTIAASSNDSHEAKIKVNKIVREIDKCIALLNK